MSIKILSSYILDSFDLLLFWVLVSVLGVYGMRHHDPISSHDNVVSEI